MKFLNFSKKFLIFCFCTLFVNSHNIFSFNSDSHSYVTVSSVDNIFDLHKNMYKNKKISKKQFKITRKIFEEYPDFIKEYSIKPDEDENQGAYKNHFYNPDTEANFVGEKDSSALKKSIEHFNSAKKEYINSYKNNSKNYDKSIEELGRAIHFAEDISTAVHSGYDETVDSVFKLSLHMRFEKLCDEICKTCKTRVLEESLKYYEVNSLDNILHAGSTISSDNFWRLENIEHGVKFAREARGSLRNAQQNVVGLIHKFTYEVAQELEQLDKLNIKN